MKRRLILTISVAAILDGCGEKFTPLTQQQINTRVDSLVIAQSPVRLTELRIACEAGIEAQVNAKIEALKKAETAEAK